MRKAAKATSPKGMPSRAAKIAVYGDEAWNLGEKQWWYDPQPHPEAVELKAPFPHHKHVPPEIKRNRIPAPGITFKSPNLPQLIREISERQRAQGKA